MNVFNKVTLQSLKKNRTRTIVTIVGIILSVSMICAVTTFVSSLRRYALKTAIYYNGDWHNSVRGTVYDTYNNILETGEIEKATALQQLGYAKLKDSNNINKDYIYLLGADKDTEEMLSVHVVNGKYPTSTDEILLPRQISKNGDAGYSIGDVISLGLGDCILSDVKLSQDGSDNMYKDDEIKNDERIDVRERRTYTVVGFYDMLSQKINPYDDFSGYTAFTFMDERMDASYKYDMYFKMKNPREVYSFSKEHSLSGPTNTDVLMFFGAFRFDKVHKVIYGMASIVIGLIMVGSISLIYNAFAISVSERTKQFGLLSSVGATKKQLRKMVLFEALFVSAIGIPLGIISGIIGIDVVLMIIEHKIKIGAPINMGIYVSGISIIVAVIVSLVTVLISAWIPSKRATKVSPVEAIRQNIDIKTNRKNVKISKLTYKFFGISGALANKYYKRNKRKCRAIVISLFMSIVLFVSVSSFSDYLMESVKSSFDVSVCDLDFTGNFDNSKSTPDELLDKTENNTAIKQSVYVQKYFISGNIDKKYLSDDCLKIQSESGKGDMMEVNGLLCFVNDEEFKKLLKEHHFNEGEFFDVNTPKSIAIGGAKYFDNEKGKYVTLNLLKSDKGVLEHYMHKDIQNYSLNRVAETNGVKMYKYKHKDKDEYIELTEEEALVKYTCVFAKNIDEEPFYLSQNYLEAIRFIYPMSMRDMVIPKNMIKNEYRFCYLSSAHKVSEEALKKTLEENGFNSIVHNNVESLEFRRNFVMIMRLFSYGFVILISLIAVANVFNTISTNISLRRREFAMLKTVGMTRKGFNRMMNFECLFYGSRALLFGLPASVGVTYLIYLSIIKGYETTFRLPWAAMGIATLSVFLVVFTTMIYAMNKIKKENPIDALKNENL